MNMMKATFFPKNILPNYRGHSWGYFYRNFALLFFLHIVAGNEVSFYHLSNFIQMAHVFCEKCTDCSDSKFFND